MAETGGNLKVRKDNGQHLAPARMGRHPLASLRDEMDRLFEDFGRDWLSPFRPDWMTGSDGDSGAWMAPDVDVSDNPKAYEISAELAGIAPSDLEVAVRNGRIIIKGEKHERSEERDKDYYVKERRFGSFERAFDLPDDVDQDRIEASYNNGVLVITLPKTAEAQLPEKRVEIKAH